MMEDANIASVTNGSTTDEEDFAISVTPGTSPREIELFVVAIRRRMLATVRRLIEQEDQARRVLAMQNEWQREE